MFKHRRVMYELPTLAHNLSTNHYRTSSFIDDIGFIYRVGMDVRDKRVTSYNLNVYICYNVIFKELYKFGFGDETLLIVPFKPIDSRLFIVMIDQLNLKNCPTVYKVGLIGIESIAFSLVCACAHI